MMGKGWDINDFDQIKAFSTDKVTSTGQLIAGIVAKSKRVAQKAASLGIFNTNTVVNAVETCLLSRRTPAEL